MVGQSSCDVVLMQQGAETEPPRARTTSLCRASNRSDVDQSMPKTTQQPDSDEERRPDVGLNQSVASLMDQARSVWGAQLKGTLKVELWETEKDRRREWACAAIDVEDADNESIAHHDGGAAKRLAAWAVTATILRENPLAAFSVPQQPKRRRKPFLDAEVPLIIDAARASCNSERDVTIVTLAIACALRKDELRCLRWPDDVDLKQEILWVRDAKTEAGVRCVPISRKALALLDIYIKDWRPSQSAGPLFLNNHGDAFSYDGFGQIFRRIAKRLPPSIHFMAHRARNTGLTNWRRAGVDIATIAKLAGHTDIAHTEHYLGNITPEEIARVPDAFSQIYGKRAG
jgi:integrase